MKLVGLRVEGEGCALANASLEQERSYFEVRVVAPGPLAVGVGTRGAPLEGALRERPQSWCVDSGDKGDIFKAGDVIGFAYDQSEVRPELSAYLNGQRLKVRFADVAGELHPAVSVRPPAVLEANFGAAPFAFAPPPRFGPVMLSVNIL